MSRFCPSRLSDCAFRYSVLFIVVLGLFPFQCSYIFAQSGRTIKGIVVDSLDEGISDASVSLHSSTTVLQTTPDSKGQFEFTNLPAGEYELVVTRRGFEESTTKGIQISDKDPERLKIVLQPGPISNCCYDPVVPSYCAQAHLPLKMIERSRLKVDDHYFSTGAWGNSTIILRNETGKAIQRVLVVVDYLDSEGNLIFSIPYLGGVDDSPLQLMEVRSFIKTVWGHPIKQGETFRLAGTNLEFTRVAPAIAKVTLVDAESEDGNSVSVTYTRTNPLLLKSPDFFQMQPDLENLPDEIWLSIAIDDRGRVGGVKFDESDQLKESDAQQITSQLKLWHFFPATSGGYAVPAQLDLRLRFHEKGFPLPAPDCPLTLTEKFPRTYVAVELQRENGSQWQVMYGSQYAHGNFDAIVSMVLK